MGEFGPLRVFPQTLGTALLTAGMIRDELLLFSMGLAAIMLAFVFASLDVWQMRDG